MKHGKENIGIVGILMSELPVLRDDDHMAAYTVMRGKFLEAVHPSFFATWKELLHDIESQHRTSMTRFKRVTGMKASMLKHFSYFGAIRVTCQLPKSDWANVYVYDKELYIDPGNWWYAKLFVNLVGESALPQTNDCTKGDVIESLFGWQFLVEHGLLEGSNVEFNDATRDLLAVLNEYFLHGYIWSSSVIM